MFKIRSSFFHCRSIAELDQPLKHTLWLWLGAVLRGILCPRPMSPSHVASLRPSAGTAHGSSVSVFPTASGLSSVSWAWQSKGLLRAAPRASGLGSWAASVDVFGPRPPVHHPKPFPRFRVPSRSAARAARSPEVGFRTVSPPVSHASGRFFVGTRYVITATWIWRICCFLLDRFPPELTQEARSAISAAVCSQ